MTRKEGSWGHSAHHWYGYMEYSISQTSTKYTISMDEIGFASSNWGFDMGGVTVKVGCTGWSDWYTKTGSVYSPYGGSVDSNIYSTYFYWSKGHSAQSIHVQFYVTNASGYENGESYGDFYITVPAKPSYTISYNANGGSGAPASHTKWYGEDTTLWGSSHNPTRTGYTFLGWATSSTGAVAYKPGAKITANKPLALYAVWKANTYTVAFNANGGSGAPASQTKTYGKTLKLSAQAPTRANYSFTGWNTKQDGSGTAYAAGANYTANSAATLYAQWKMSWVAPTISGLFATRSDGTQDTVDGTQGHVVAAWSVDTSVDPDNAAVSARLEWKASGATEWTERQLPLTGTVDEILEGPFDPRTQYDIRLTVQDAHLSSTAQTVITTAQFTFEVLRGGQGIAFGKPATEVDVLDSAWDISTDGAFRAAGTDVELYADQPYADVFRRWVMTAAGNIRMDTSADGSQWDIDSYFARTPADTPMRDYIYEVGSNGGTTANPQWRWVKFASGYAIAWGYYGGGTWAATDAWGSLYYKETSRVSNPFTWAGAPYEWMQPQGTAYFWCVGHNAATTTQTGTYYLISPTKQTTARAATLNFLQIGRWK